VRLYNLRAKEASALSCSGRTQDPGSLVRVRAKGGILPLSRTKSKLAGGISLWFRVDTGGAIMRG
jgi:hypothetical protein